MNDLKERFDNLEINPDPQVWESISDTMRHRVVVRRRAIVGSASAAVVAALVFAFINRQPKAELPERTAPIVAQNTLSAESETTVRESSSAVVYNQDNATTPVAVAPQKNSQQSASDIPAEVQVTTESLEVPVQSSELEAPNTTTTKQIDTPVETVEANVNPVATTNTANLVTPKATVDPLPTKATPKVSTERDVKAPATELVVWIPNAFAPDDPDEAVRLFKVRPNNNASIVSFEMYIYSRGGRMVYHSKDINQGWDGIANGHSQPMGTYVYVIQVNDAVTGLHHYKGTITLIR